MNNIHEIAITCARTIFLDMLFEPTPRKTKHEEKFSRAEHFKNKKILKLRESEQIKT